MAQPPQEADTVRLPPTAIRIVIVEDRPSDAELMILGLQEEGFAPDWQRVEDDLALVIALEGNPDLILSDWSLPHFSGLEALGIVRERDPHVPFIIVSGSVGEEAAIDALHRGADDYVLKDRLARLGPAVRRVLEAERLRAERRRAAAQLAFQASVLANVRDAVIVSDLAGRITYWNDGATATFGYAAAEMVGRPMGELSPTHAPALEAALKASAADPGSTGTWPMRHRDGRQLWIEARTASMTDPAGAPIGIIGVARDVTEHRRRELEAGRRAPAMEPAPAAGG